MSNFSFQLRRKRGPKNVDKSSYNFPTLPNELWLPILIEAMEPSLILDPYCFATNLEHFHHAITNPTTAHDKLACKVAHRMRQSLSLVCRLFRTLVQSIPKKSTEDWLYQADNEPIGYIAPKLRWTDESNKQCARLDLRLAFEHTHRLIVKCSRPVQTYRLFVSRSVAERGVTAQFYSFEELLPTHTTLKVLHMDLEYCAPRLQASAGYDPLSSMLVEDLLGGLTTLSLVMSANGTREILYQPLHLLRLRVLFLKFPVYGVEEDGLRLWRFDSLSVLSLHTMEKNRNVNRIPRISPVVVHFLRRHAQQIHGLRLQPGPWAFPYRSPNILPFDESDLWDAFSTLSSLSTDFRYLHEHLEATSKADNVSIRRLISRLTTISQCGSSMVSSFANGLQTALDIASNCLESVILRNENGSLILDPRLSPRESDIMAMNALRAHCQQRHIKLTTLNELY
ncbi:hypothetical protein PIIN_04399 [Serendipita indica DSM 11827]|uniref:Uncharacterized protein n=1 Tax=Serendipita indica (strain DSM 11827) TaxID=1109443 RepID=G4TGL2_SERID|nr:hypothetical protein PIIN_04399 [Serendipita indica DSM 11827]